MMRLSRSLVLVALLLAATPVGAQPTAPAPVAPMATAVAPMATAPAAPMVVAPAPMVAVAPMTAAPAPVAPAMAPVASVAPAPAATPAPAMPAETVSGDAATPAMAVTPPVEGPKVAPAPAKDSFWKTFGGIVLQILLVILTVGLPIVLTPLVSWLTKKMKVEDAKTQQMIDDMVDKAVVHGLNYANEQAHKLRDNPVASADKLNMAADKALAYLKDSGIVDKGAEYLKDLIESKLGEGRAPTTKAAEKPAETPTEEKPDNG